MEFLIALLKSLALTAVLLSPVICIFIGWLRFEKECDEYDQKRRYLFGGDLYKKGDE